MAARKGIGFPFPAQPDPPRISTKELRKIQKRHKRLRERFKEIRGKRVDWIEHWSEEGLCFFSVRFTDGKEFSIVCHPDIVTDSIDFSDWKTGDQVILRKYYRRREH